MCGFPLIVYFVHVCVEKAWMFLDHYIEREIFNFIIPNILPSDTYQAREMQKHVKKNALKFDKQSDGKAVFFEVTEKSVVPNC